MNATILSVGDELVLGQTVDTNSAWISQQLAAVGCDVVSHKTVGDDQDLIEAAILEAAEISELVIVSGGLGPTEDDLTRQAIAEVMEVELVEDNRWTDEIRRYFQTLGRQMPEKNLIQSMIPRGAELVWNTCGTAAGIKANVQTVSLQDDPDDAANLIPVQVEATLFAVPGVPKEMKAMFTRDILPWVSQRTGGAIILQRTIHTFGVGESTVAERLGALMTRGRNPSVGTTVSHGIVSLRVNARFPSLAEATAQLEQTSAQCRAALGELVFGEDGQTLPEIVGEILRQKKDIKIVTAESCTGGLVAKMLTDVPGSSAYVDRSYVTYSNEAKTELLGVPAELIAAHGAVSEAVVSAMAGGARKGRNDVVSIALSGVAGPGGGTPEKPVGTVWIALSHAGGTEARRFVFPGDREMIRDRSAKMALTLVRFHLLGHKPPF
jgi:nicotinamide-nucleotide amidase